MPSSVPLTRGTPAAYAPAAPRVAVRSWLTFDGRIMKKKYPQVPAEYPAATIAFYGPNDQVATKAVIGIVPVEGADVNPIHKWLTGVGDIRHDAVIAKEMKDFIALHRVKTIASVERIIGCPHEEGKDYPDGTNCPRCPFWAGRDRFTGERKS